MVGPSFSLLVLASLTAINADSCGNEDSYPRLSNILDIANQLRSLPQGNEIQSGFELVRDFFKTTNVPVIGSINPLYIETYRIQLDDDDEINAAVDITATTIEGLLGFEVTDVKISLNSEKFQVDFLFPKLSASGQYNILPTPQQSEFYGTGEFDLTGKNLRVQVTGDIDKTSDGEMFVEQLKSELSLEAVDAKITGLFDDELASEMASAQISEYLPEYLPILKSDIDEFLEIYAEYVNTKLKFLKFLK